jgi:hypothetical protein
VFIYGVFALGCGSSSSVGEVGNSINNLKEDIYIEKNNLSKRSKTDLSNQNLPILEYRFDMCQVGSNLVDEMGNFDATIKNNPTLIKSTLNRAIKLDGKDDFIKLPTMDVDYSNGFTFSAWVMFDKEAGEGKNWETIFSFGNDDSGKSYEDKHKSEIWLNRYYKSNKLYFAFTNGDRDNLCADVKTVDDVLKPKTMQHIAVSIDSKNYPHIFIDGKEVEVEVAWHNEGGACELASTTRDLCYIGKPNDEWMGLDNDNGHKDHKDNNLLNGVIDEVKIYNQTLTNLNIKDIYEAEKAGLNYDNSQRESIVCEQKPSVIKNPKPIYKDPKIIVDANSYDWKDIEGVSLDNGTIKTYSDGVFAYFLFESKTIKDPLAIWFIDSDNNSKTGHQATDWSESGADFAIGNSGKLYIAKTNDSKWEWDSQTLNNATKFASKNGVIEVMVKKSDFNLKDSYRVGVRVDDGSIDTLAFPKKTLLSYTQTKKDSDLFSPIRTILSQDGSTYICIGDSTRADDSHFKNDEIFKSVSAVLGDGVHTILEAYPGKRAKDWVRDSIESLISQIPENGETTVINISLGINDARVGATKESLLLDLTNGISKILLKKPDTHIMLTMPNSMIGIDSSSYIEAYKELSKEYPMIDTQDIFASKDLSLYRSDDATEYGSSIRIHLSSKGQKLISDRIIQNIK